MYQLDEISAVLNDGKPEKPEDLSKNKSAPEELKTEEIASLAVPDF